MSKTMRDPFTLDATGATLTIRATPKASKTAVTGVVALEAEATALGLRVAAPPVHGAANDEVMRFVAKQLRVGRSAVTLVAGQTSRVKRLRIEGEPGTLEAALRACCPNSPP
ncbi:DUF167 domain-containing protein [Sphingomonas sp. Leaf10]|uniref:DUF167 domain-containing protein n=1 Tax=Sphingomonas sp. Leaf10 TaxID=1735676 RepID=UPI0006FF19D7|nr:DUF167 domain-containing protein [Sphingomonas sp. Leaf10]